MAKNNTDKIIEFIALYNQLIWILCPSISALHLHYIDSTFKFRLRTAEHIKQAIEDRLNACDIDKQWVDVILHDNLRNMKKAVDDMEVTSVGRVSHTHQLAVHEGLLSQCSVTHSPANTRKAICQCWNSICRIRKSHMNVHTLFQQNKKKNP